MNRQKPMQGRVLILTGIGLFLVAAVATFWLRTGDTSARAGSPPPNQPQFDGISVDESYPVSELSGRTAPQSIRSATAWEIIFSEDWEAGFDGDIWLTLDRNGAQDGEFKWAVREFENTLSGGNQSAWSVGGGLDGQNLDLENEGYPQGVDSWLIYGPIDLSQALDAELSFNYWFEADAGDEFSVLISTDGTNWEGKQTDSGGSGQWFGRNYSLEAYVGQPIVYAAFHFTSDDEGASSKIGALVDDIEIRADYGSKQFLPLVQVQPTATPTATATPPPPTPTAVPPSGIFLDNFTDNIDGWAARRAHDNAVYGYSHRGDSDGGRQGVLEITMPTTYSYVIVSPLVEAKEPPYNIEFYAKLKEPEDRHMYGLVFGADWNGGDCNAPSSTNCFTSYYELRVQYRDFDDKRFQEVKLKRIESHDANGEPDGPTLLDWKKGGNVGTDDWVEIDVYVTADGKIRISWNGKYIAEVQDSTLIDQPYFGLMLLTRENNDGRVKYDYIKID